MRRLTPLPGPQGLTLIELMVGLSIMAMLALAAAPFFSDFGTNSRLRESGNTLFGEAMFAQSEAIKRNRPVRLSSAGSTITVADMTDPANPVTLRTSTLSQGVTAANASVTFGTQGWPSNLTAVAINLSHAVATCSSDHRCPGLRVDAGGAVRLCGNQLVNCS
jgi:type IV fimbrial biogenesis protein FimT